MLQPYVMVAAPDRADFKKHTLDVLLLTATSIQKDQQVCKRHDLKYRERDDRKTDYLKMKHQGKNWVEASFTLVPLIQDNMFAVY